MTSGDLKKAKREVRREILRRRDAIAADVRDAKGLAIAARAMSLEVVRGARTALAFWSFGSEPPTVPLIEALRGAGARVALPRIAGEDLELRTYAPGDPLIEATFGAMEPAGGEPVRPDELDLIVTPGVAFDLDGRRIGYGGGFYDRLLPRAPGAARIAIAFDVQVVEGPLPAGAFDLPVDAIVTETRVVRPPRSA